MSTLIKIFNNPQFGEIRTSTSENGEPLFCLIDLTNALGLTNARVVAQRLDQDEVRKLDLRGQIGETNFVTESGMYTVILRSDSPLAKPMQKWVTGEVLPTIRKTGGYIATKEDDTAEAIMARALIVAKDTLDRQARRIAEQQAKINEDASRVLFSRAVETSTRSILVGELAKYLCQNGVEIGQNRLFAILRNTGYLCASGESYNLPTQRAMDLGLFEIKKTTINKPDGTILVSTTTKVTGKGSIYFTNKFLKNKVKA